MFVRPLTGALSLVALCLSFPVALPYAIPLPSVSEAERLTSEAAALVTQAATAQRGIDTLQQALAIWRRAGDRPGEARTLFLIGRGYNRLSRQEHAMTQHSRCEGEWR